MKKDFRFKWFFNLKIHSIAYRINCWVYFQNQCLGSIRHITTYKRILKILRDMKEAGRIMRIK